MDTILLESQTKDQQTQTEVEHTTQSSCWECCGFICIMSIIDTFFS